MLCVGAPHTQGLCCSEQGSPLGSELPEFVGSIRASKQHRSPAEEFGKRPAGMAVIELYVDGQFWLRVSDTTAEFYVASATPVVP